MKNWFYLRKSPHSLMDLCRASLLYTAGLLLAPQAKAQFNVYHPFPDSNAVWGMQAVCTDWNCGSYRYVQDYMAGDTVLEGILYKKIDQAVSVDYAECSCQIPEDLGQGFLRDDTLARKVYWRFPDSNEDTLLYDFNLGIGDTLRGLLARPGQCGDMPTVQSIDSILLGGSYRKRFNFFSDPCGPTSIIEGVGGTTGLTSCNHIPSSFGYRLECFTVGDSLLYSAPCGPYLFLCTDFPSGIREDRPYIDKVVAFQPNPCAGSLKLVCRLCDPPLDLLICDVTGKAVYRGQILPQESEFEISSLGKGIYMALVFQKGVLIQSEKLFKQ